MASLGRNLMLALMAAALLLALVPAGEACCCQTGHAAESSGCCNHGAALSPCSCEPETTAVSALAPRLDHSGRSLLWGAGPSSALAVPGLNNGRPAGPVPSGGPASSPSPGFLTPLRI